MIFEFQAEIMKRALMEFAGSATDEEWAQAVASLKPSDQGRRVYVAADASPAAARLLKVAYKV